jgi:hypothetical protein
MTDDPGDIAIGSTRWIKLRRSGQANPFSPRLIMRRFGPIGRHSIVRARPWLPTPRLPGSRFRPRLPRLTTLGRLGTLEVRLA